MADITQAILAELDSDQTINTMNICIDIVSKGVFKKSKTLHVHGSVRSQDQKDKVERIARRFAGDTYAFESHLVIK